MFVARIALRGLSHSVALSRPLSTTARRLADNSHPNAADHRKAQKEKTLNPHMTNTNSTIANEMPSAGKNKVPPEFITSVDPDFTPKDSVPENTERMTGGTQKGEPEKGPNAKLGKAEVGNLESGEMGVGELEGAEFKVEPLRRTGEDKNTMRARLVYQSRKRGTLESDLLMSTFADTYLEHMSMAQMQQYDLFLDENDWDIYYWATQEPTPTSQETAEGAHLGGQGATPPAAGKNAEQNPVARGTDPGKQTGPELESDEYAQGKPVAPSKGEWAQTVGTFKPAYRPVPARWKNSEVLAMLRKHVLNRSAGGNVIDHGKVGEDVLAQATGKGMAFMPEVRNMDS